MATVPQAGPSFIDDSFCSGRPDGDYADPGLTTAYYTCRAGETFHLPCPWEMTFDPTLANQTPDNGRLSSPCSIAVFTGSF
ncbi:chitin binding peritrophin-A domain-containing protein [Nocardia sp. NPDC020380]|uniref:chitin binding peritrophin-A domain-containing protein n=1 Tax=Nocardia sp. NPDC020380 TaxID=3364309 RepID=UPI0037AB187F